MSKNSISPTRNTLDLFCFGLPTETELCASLVPSDNGEWHMTPQHDRYVENGEVQMEKFLRTLEHYREDVALCSDAYVSLAYFPDRQQAESTTLIPAAVMKRLASCGVGLEVTTYPHGGDRQRFGGVCHCVLVRSAGDEAGSIKLPPSIRASLRARGLTPTAAFEDIDITFADQQEFIAHYIPENNGISVFSDTAPNLLTAQKGTDAATDSPKVNKTKFSLNKYLGRFAWPTFMLDKEVVAALAAPDYDIEFHFDFPQRRGLKLRTIVRA